jgi:hypothetical protein
VRGGCATQRERNPSEPCLLKSAYPSAALYCQSVWRFGLTKVTSEDLALENN